MYVRLCLCFIKKVAYAAAVEKVYLDGTSIMNFQYVCNVWISVQNCKATDKVFAQVAESNLHILHCQNVAM